MQRLRRPTPRAAIVAAAVLGGLAVRAWILTSPLSALDSDEAIVGLMAQHALRGEFTVLYWLNNYGGPHEAWLTAVVFAALGSSTLALKLTTLALFAVGALLIWRVGLRTVASPAAELAAALFWVAPAYLVWWTTKARGFYAFGLVAELVVLLLALRLRQRDSRLDAVGLGLAFGLGFWANPEVLVVALPALAWLAWQRPRALRLTWLALPAFVLAVSPWLAWNARNNWLSLDLRSVAGERSTYTGRLTDLFRVVWPTWLGVRVPFSLDWLLGAAVGIVVVAASLVGLALLVRSRPPRLGVLILIAVAFPFLYAASSFAFFVAEPRYLVLFSPVPALLLAWFLGRYPWPVAASTLAAVFALSLGGLVRMEHEGLYEPLGPHVASATDISPLIELLRREHVDRVLADYWIAYRLNFETHERVLATSTGFVRDQHADRIVRASAWPAHVFVRGTPMELRARRRLERRGYRRLTTEDFSVYVHRQL
ncbi:MAG TPA: glycosyltransferase family 39 protein [Gaiellaceae bacterium]|jgi:hypothetical protein